MSSDAFGWATLAESVAAVAVIRTEVARLRAGVAAWVPGRRG